jgi:hypothetical protein
MIEIAMLLASIFISGHRGLGRGGGSAHLKGWVSGNLRKKARLGAF